MLACVGRANAAPGCSNLARWRLSVISRARRKESATSELDFLKAVDSHVQVKHNVAAVRDQDLVPYVLQSFVFQLLQLLEEAGSVRSISNSVDLAQGVVRSVKANDSGAAALSQQDVAVVGKGEGLILTRRRPRRHQSGSYCSMY